MMYCLPYTHTHTHTQMDTLRAHVSYSDNTQTSHDVISCLTLAVREMYVGKCRSRPRIQTTGELGLYMGRNYGA